MKLLKSLRSMKKILDFKPGLSDSRAHTLSYSTLQGTGLASQMVWGSICDDKKKAV